MLSRVFFSLLVVARGFPGPAGQSDAWERMAAILVAGDTVVRTVAQARILHGPSASVLSACASLF
jgi:hypothetical protein